MRQMVDYLSPREPALARSTESDSGITRPKSNDVPSDRLRTRGGVRLGHHGGAMRGARYSGPSRSARLEAC